MYKIENIPIRKILQFNQLFFPTSQQPGNNIFAKHSITILLYRKAKVDFYTGNLVSLLLCYALFLLLFFLIGNELRVCTKESVPPCEGRGVVANKVHVMEIMETGPSIERHQVKRVQWDIVATIGQKKKKNNQGKDFSDKSTQNIDINLSL